MPSLISEEDRVRLQGLAQGVTQQRMLREMAEAVEVMAADTPLIFLLEDLHWSDHSTLDLITAIARRTETARLMILGTYRPVEMLVGDHPLRTVTTELALHDQCEKIRRGSLSEEEVKTYLLVRLTSQAAGQIHQLAPAVYQRSEGNPLFMVNVVDYLVAQESSFDKSKIEAPRNIVQMIERNLERLQPDEQAILEGASVAGAEFATAAVAAALQRPAAEIEACCMRLARREQFVSLAGEVRWPDGTVSANVRFLHALYREALYERVPPIHRVEFHRRVAERSESAFGDRSKEIAAALASHYVRANDHEKAIIYLTMTAQQALQRSAHADAVVSASQGLKLLAVLPPSAERAAQELALQTVLGIALMPIKGWAIPEVEQAFARAEELLRGLDETPELVPVLYGIWGFSLARGQLRKATEPALHLLGIARKTMDSAPFMAAHCALGITCFWTGDLLKSNQHFDELIEHYTKDQHAVLTSQFGINLGIFGLGYSSYTLWLRGFPDQAVKTVKRSIEMARETGHGETLAWARQVDAHLSVFRREHVEARIAAEEVFSVCDAHGLVIQSALVKMSHGWAMAVAGDHEAGCAEIREAFDAFAAVGLVLGESTHRMMLADALLLAGRAEEGLASLDQSLARAKSDERNFASELRRLRGELLLLRKDGNERREVSGAAESAFREAVQIAQSQNARSLELRATTSLARLLRDTGRRDEARTMLVDIYNWFTEGFDTKDLKDAKALLDELSAPVTSRPQDS